MQPAGSIVMYATSANSVAQDGSGRNGVFTGELLRQLETPGLEIGEVVRRTGAAVQQVTGGRQVPAVSNQFFQTFYLKPSGTDLSQFSPTVQTPAPSFGAVTVATGSLTITVASTATVSLLGQSVELPAGGSLPVNNVAVGEIAVAVRYADGKTENRSVQVEANHSNSQSFDYRPSLHKIGDRGPAGGIVFYDKGNSEGGWRYLESTPSDTRGGIQWFNGNGDGIDIKGTDTAIGTGRDNTVAIIAALGNGSYAALVCHNLSLGGYSDWFLPSKDELNLMYQNLKKSNLGEFRDAWYWSSSHGSYGYGPFAWHQIFSVGIQDRGYNRFSYSAVRAVRAFTD